MNNLIISRKESIILGAVEIIDKLGLQGLSIKELAQNQGITEGALYKHFKSKDDIILEVLDYYAYFDTIIVDTIKVKKLSGKEAIKFFIGSYAEYYENYPGMAAIDILYETFNCDRLASRKIKDIFEARSNLIIELIEKGKEKGDFPLETNSENFSIIIIGLLRESILKWRLNGFKFSLKEKVLSTLDMLL